jgi:lysophospholipase L1-like esterase
MRKKVVIGSGAAVLAIAMLPSLRHQPNLDYYRQANDKVANPSLVIFGDSRAHGVARQLGAVDRGIGGEATPEMRVRFVQDGIGVNPKAVVVVAGINDVGRRFWPISGDTTIENLDAMAASAIGAGAQTVCVPVVPASRARSARYELSDVRHINDLFTAYCSATKIPVADIEPLLSDGYLSDRFTTDGLHLNDAGNQILGNAIAQKMPPVGSAR